MGIIARRRDTMSSNDKENDEERTTTTTTSPSKTFSKSASVGTSVLKQKYAALMESRNKYKEESEEAKRNVKALEKRVVQLEAELASGGACGSPRAVRSRERGAESGKESLDEERRSRRTRRETRTRFGRNGRGARAAHGDDARVGRVRWGHHRVRGARGIRQVSSINVMT